MNLIKNEKSLCYPPSHFQGQNNSFPWKKSFQQAAPLPREKTLNLFLIGPGHVGSALLDLLHDQQKYVQTAFHLQLHVAGIMNSKKMVFHEHGIPLAEWRHALASSPHPSNLQEFSNIVRQFKIIPSLVVDCTGSERSVQHYIDLLGAHVSIVTSSKIANSLSYDFYRQLRTVSAFHGVQFRYSTNVGAALPIIESVKCIVNNGDSLQRIEAVLSGSLSYIFNKIGAGMPFSEAVRRAQQHGFTEPDPLLDLSGTDVARKLLILIREAGIQFEMDEIIVESCLPPSVKKRTPLETALQEAERIMEARREAAGKENRRLMYIARFENRYAHVGIEEISPDHPFYSISGNDNIFSLTTQNLYRQPLLVRGGGAGPQLTASGVFNDIIYTSQSLN